MGGLLRRVGGLAVRGCGAPGGTGWHRVAPGDPISGPPRRPAPAGEAAGGGTRQEPQELGGGCGHRHLRCAILSVPPVFAGRPHFPRSPRLCRAVRPV